MPRRRKPPRLYLDPKRKTWTIRYGNKFKRLPFTEDERLAAEVSLQRVLNNQALSRDLYLGRNARRRSSSPRERTEGIVYFASKVGCSEYPIKIGFSGIGSKPRLGDLQIGNPHQLEMLTQTPATYVIEQALHLILADARGGGEWFARTENVMAALCAAREGSLSEWVSGRYCAETVP